MPNLNLNVEVGCPSTQTSLDQYVQVKQLHTVQAQCGEASVYIHLN